MSNGRPAGYMYPGHFELDGMLVIGTSAFHREISSIVQEVSIFQS